MAYLQAAPLLHFGTLFDLAAGVGCEAPAPILSLSPLFAPSSGRNIIAETASYALSGKAANLKVGRKFAANYGTFTFTFRDAGLNYSALGAGAGSPAPLLALSTLFDGGTTLSGVGAAVPLLHLSTLFERSAGDRLLTAASGSFAFTGSSANLLRGLALNAESGAFAAQFAPADRDLELDGEKGSFVMTGSAAGMVYRGGNPALSGAYAFTFNPATLRFQFLRITAETGVFTIGPENANLIATKHQTSGWRGSGGIHESGLLDVVKRKKKKRKKKVIERPADYL